MSQVEEAWATRSVWPQQLFHCTRAPICPIYRDHPVYPAHLYLYLADHHFDHSDHFVGFGHSADLDPAAVPDSDPVVAATFFISDKKLC